MHDLQDERNSVDYEAGLSADILGRECAGCSRLLLFNQYRRDSSQRDGYKPLCMECESVPRLSLQEHTARLREKNLSSAAVKAQRHPDQDHFHNDAERVGRVMSCGEFLVRLKKLVPSLYVTDGNFIGDLSLYQTFGQPQPDLNGQSFAYICYVPIKPMIEFSTYEFNSQGVMVREKERGWRTVLLKMIRKGLFTEEQCRREFGEAVGPASVVWHKNLHAFRNRQ